VIQVDPINITSRIKNDRLHASERMQQSLNSPSAEQLSIVCLMNHVLIRNSKI
ncbi:35006_t:CDS:1, partial [Gigaspora margarita]